MAKTTETSFRPGERVRIKSDNDGAEYYVREHNGDYVRLDCVVSITSALPNDLERITESCVSSSVTVATLWHTPLDLLLDSALLLEANGNSVPAGFVREAFAELKRNREPSDDRVRYVIKEFGLEEDIGDAVAFEDVRRILREANKR